MLEAHWPSHLLTATFSSQVLNKIPVPESYSSAKKERDLKIRFHQEKRVLSLMYSFNFPDNRRAISTHLSKIGETFTI